VTMEIGKLRVLKLLIEFSRAGLFQKSSVGPQTANCDPSGFRVWTRFCSFAFGWRCSAGHICSPSISLSHQV